MKNSFWTHEDRPSGSAEPLKLRLMLIIFSLTISIPANVYYSHFWKLHSAYLDFSRVYWLDNNQMLLSKVLVQNFREGFFIDIIGKANVHLDEIYVLNGKSITIIDHLFLHIFDELEHPQLGS
jgi:hypothetical protein